MTSPLTASQLSQLIADLNPNRIAHRKQGSGNGPQLSYLEAWDVRTALIRIFGFGGWSYSTAVEVLAYEADVPKRNGSGTQFRVTVMATVKLFIPQLGAYYQEAAVSSQSQPDPGECADFAVKTAESDALKRCAVNLGSQFGLSLYNKGATGDVVKVVRQVDQASILRQLAEGKSAREIDGSAHTAEPTDSEFQHGYDPEHGATEAAPDPDSQEPDEAPGVDVPMALDEPPVDPQKQADAAAALKRGFNRER